MLEHGFFTIELEEELLISCFFSAWNFEQTKHYQEQVKLAAKPLLKRPWARLVDLSLWEGGGEEVIKPLADLQAWAEQHNCYEIIFINPPLVPKFMLEKYGDLYSEFQIFEDIDEAKRWALEQLSDV